MIGVAERFRLQPIVTASLWGTVWESIWSGLQRDRGMQIDREGTTAPKLTNREAIAIVAALRKESQRTTAGFPLWYQFAAIAYGWDPDNDRLDISDTQRDRVYPADMAVELFLAVQKLTFELEKESPTDPRLELDSGAFADNVFQGEVIAALHADGAFTTAVIPLCKDKKTGKWRFPKAACDADGKGPRARDPATGREIELPCDKPGECEPKPIGKIAIPVTKKTALLIAAGLAAIYVFAPAALSGVIAGRGARNSRRGRRTRRR